MNKIILSVAVAATLFSTAAFSASDIHLQIKNSKGESQIVSCPSGACVIPSLVADTYTVALVDAKGKPVTESGTMSCDIKSPRDSASGMATGRRQYQPIHISTGSVSSSVAVTQNESNLAITCAGSTSPVSPSTTTTTADKPVKASYDLKSATK